MKKDTRPFVKLFYDILDWGWYGDTNTFRVFMHILLKANYQETEYKGYKIPAGSCVFGRKAWAEELGMTERQVRTALDHLKATNEIAIKTTNRFSIVSLAKWDFWQLKEGKATNKTTNDASDKRPANDQQTTTPKDNIYISSSLRSEDIYRGVWGDLRKAIDDFVEMRKRIKAPMTERAISNLLAKLDRLAGDDDELKIKILEQSIFNSWKGVYELKDGNDNGTGNSQRRELRTGISGSENDMGGASVELPPVYLD